MSDSALRCWGQNHTGQLGYGYVENIGDDETPASAEAVQYRLPQMNQVLSNKNVAADFGRIVFDLLVAQMKAGQLGKGPPSSQRR